jgi:hypothetical protein
MLILVKQQLAESVMAIQIQTWQLLTSDELTTNTVASSEGSNATEQHDDDGDGHDKPI